jgi:uncharacterized lipoprotein
MLRKLMTVLMLTFVVATVAGCDSANRGDVASRDDPSRESSRNSD